LLLTEAGTKKRASLYLVKGDDALTEHDPGGLEPLECSAAEFSTALLSENRTLKRALTNPRTFSGIGNAYSDEILHAAKLSPVRLTNQLDREERDRLFESTRSVLTVSRDQLRRDAGDTFPEKVTAFRPAMAVHGKFGKPCPECGAPVARIRYKSNETNYCPGCQTGGKVLADRSLSRLLKDDWPGTL
jgi:formamidopyrimidine-DNA glycosylase